MILSRRGRPATSAGFAYEMTPDSATLTRRYVENQRDVLKSANQCVRHTRCRRRPFHPLDGTGEDVVGNNYASIISDPTFAEGKNGQGLALNGSGQYADTGAALLDTSGNYSASVSRTRISGTS